ncbi:MAG: tetratricopeptide repeat protein [Bacteroidota bacterium]
MRSKFITIGTVLSPRYLIVILLTASQYSSGGEKSQNPIPRDYHYPYPLFITRGGNEDTQLQEIFSLTQKANSGDPISQYNLGLYYLLGIGTVPDTVKAAYWTQKAAQLHHAVASYNMAVFYSNGWGVPWNPFEAYRSIEFAAKAGLPEAEYFMCRFYIENLVIPRDLHTAYRWVKLAADSGYAPAKDVVAEFLRRGWIKKDDLDDKTPVDNPNDTTADSQQKKKSFQPVFLDFSHDTTVHVDNNTLIKEALRETESSTRLKSDSIDDSSDSIVVDSAMRREIYFNASMGSPEALVVIARWLENGIGVKKDIVMAAANYIRAIRLDSPRAPRLLWDMIQDGKFYSRLKSRVDSGDPVARYVWAELIALGFDHQLTEEQAWELLIASAKDNYEPALIECGMNYFKGFWVKQSKEKALQLWQSAAEMGCCEARIRIITVQTVGNQKATLPPDTLAFLSQSAKNGSVLAQALLGYCFEAGIGVVQNNRFAVEYYRDAAQRGSAIAYKGLLRMYDGIRPKDRKFQVGE